ncbi:MAG TPA: MFS transporter [Dehalococcoidia bacterium]|nr:MFS transporter [Dehalococcoidia bacterium]
MVSISRIGSLLTGLAVDITPLRRSRDFRFLFGGQIVNLIGSQLTLVALPYQVFLLTHSSLWVGLLAGAQLIPLLSFSLIGGSIADIVDRRKLLAITQVLLACSSAMLAVAAWVGHTPLWYLFAVAIISACVQAIAQPTYRAVIPQLVPRDQMTNAMALNQLVNQSGRISGAALAGLVLAAFGVRWSYTLDALTFGVAVFALMKMSPMPAEEQGSFRDRFSAIAEGLSFLKKRPVLMSTFLVDINATFFGGPSALYPALALTIFHVGPQGLGFLYAAPGAGAFLGALVTGWAKNVRHQGMATILLICVWGAAIACFGLINHWFLLALVFLGIAGAADTWSALFRSAMLQAALPDRMRGRISAVHFMSVTGGPRLGAMESGTVAALTNVQVSIVSGGLLSVAGALLIGLAVPAYARYDAKKAIAEAPVG